MSDLWTARGRTANRQPETTEGAVQVTSWGQVNGQYRKGLIHLVDRRPEAALAEWADLGGWPEQAPALAYNRGLARLWTGDHRGAAADFRLAMVPGAGPADASLGLAVSLWLAEQPGAATEEVSRAAAGRPSVPRVAALTALLGQADPGPAPATYAELVARLVSAARRTTPSLSLAVLAGSPEDGGKQGDLEPWISLLAARGHTLEVLGPRERLAPSKRRLDAVITADWGRIAEALRGSGAGAVPFLLCLEAKDLRERSSSRPADRLGSPLGQAMDYLFTQPCRLIAVDEETRALLASLYGRVGLTGGNRGETRNLPEALEDLVFRNACTLQPDLQPLAKSVARADAVRAGVKPQTISLCLIARNEENNLQRCLTSVAEVVDELIVGDTGSTDQSRALAARLGAEVVDVPWKGDFSAARNAVLERAGGGWVLQLDADDALNLRRGARSDAAAEAYYFVVKNVVDFGPSGSVEEAQLLRFFRNRPDHRFSGTIHEQILPSILAAGGQTAALPVRLHHYGYLPSEVAAKGKVKRNLKLLEDALRKDPHNVYLGYQLSVEQMRIGDYQNAARNIDIVARHLLALGESAFALDDFFLAAILKAIDAMVLADHPERGLELAEQFTERCPDYLEGALARGRVLSILGRYREAATQFMRCIGMGESKKYVYTRGAAWWQAWHELGRVYEATGNPSEAVAAYRQALAGGRSSLASYERLAVLILQGEKPEAAMSYLRGLIPTLEPRHRFSATWILAKAMIGRGLFREAEGTIKEGLTTDRGGPEPVQGEFQAARYWLAVALEGQNRYGEAAAIFADLADRSSLGREPVWHLSLCLMLAGRPREAEGHLKPLVAVAGAQARLYQELARALARKSEGRPTVPTPVGDLSQPETKRAFLALAERLLELNEAAVLAVLISLARPVFTEPGEADRELGKLYYRRGDFDQALASLVAAAGAGSTDGESLADLGNLAWRKGLLEDAVEFLRHSVQADPGRLESHVDLARVLVAFGRRQEALGTVRTALAGPFSGHAALLALEKEFSGQPG